MKSRVVMHVWSGEAEFRNKVLERYSAADFMPGVFSRVVVEVVHWKDKSDSAGPFLRSFPGRLALGKPVVCATRLGPYGLDCLNEFTEGLSPEEVERRPEAVSGLRSVAVFRLAEESLDRFASLVWKKLMGFEVGLAIEPESVDDLLTLFRQLPRPLFRRLITWYGFWEACCRHSELTLLPNDGCRIEVHSSRDTPEELQLRIRKLAQSTQPTEVELLSDMTWKEIRKMRKELQSGK